MTMTRFVTSFLLATLIAASTWAVAPTQEAIEKWKAEGTLKQIIDQRNELKKEGLDAPNDIPVIDRRAIQSRLAAGAQVTDTLNVVVIMVEFSDNLMASGNAAGTPAKFDSILFSDQEVQPYDSTNPTGSMTDYYKEATYQQIYLKGDIYGPYMAPNPYSYYVGTDNGLTGSRELVQWLVQYADPYIDYSKYARDNVHCDGLVIIHAGRGAEEGVYGIWSHKWTIGTSVVLDGVYLSNYTMNPEESGTALSPIGVFCHEYGHFLGLPDLYDINDTTGTSLGLGEWSLMANGNYLGGSKKPAHFDAYCREQIGVLSYAEVTNNLHQAEIPDATYNPVVYRLRNADTGPNEYWLVENRQKTGFDLDLPGTGVCIYHVDDNIGGSNHLPIYHVALEQADGKNDLMLTPGNDGDAGDPWPGATNNRNFHDYTDPSASLNYGGPSGIAVWDISNSDSLMYADLDIEPSRPYIQLYGSTPVVFDDASPRGNGNGIPEAGETVRVYCTAINGLRDAYNPRLTVTTSNPYVTFTTPTAPFGSTISGAPISNTTPVEFVVADSIVPVIDSFFLTITSDSLPSTPGSDEYSAVFGVEKQVGKAQVLIVDDDRGNTYETAYHDAFYKSRVPTEIWPVKNNGVPSATYLADFNMVFWHTGDTTTGVIDAAKIASMKSYMDGGGNLLLSSAGGVRDIATSDSAFLANYFGAVYTGSTFWFIATGVTGTDMGQATKYRLDASLLGTAPLPWVTVLPGSEGFMYQSNAPTHIWGVSSSPGTFKSVLLTIPGEYISPDYVASGYGTIDTLIHRTMNFFGGIPTSVYDGSPFAGLPRSFDLVQNYPNPFNPTTTISYTLRATDATGNRTPRTKLVVYNALGQQVKTLVDKVQVPGVYSVEWDGRTDSGNRAASGLYFYRLERGEEAQTKKMVLLK